MVSLFLRYSVSRESAADTKEARDKRIFDLWLACWTQEEIAEQVGCSVQPVKEVISDYSAELPENLKPHALHQVAFDPPLYNVWKQQEKTGGSSLRVTLSILDLRSVKR